MKKIWFYTLLLLTLGLTACQDTDKLEADLDSLGDRVAALENKVEMLNGNIKALNILCQDGMVISKVEHNEADGVYSITLSDGTTVKLMEKIAGFGIAPLVSINADGNWQVSYDNGVTYQPILKGDAPVNAVGKNGVTPMLRVGAGDFWEVSVDGGTTYAQVKDVNNQPVKAVYDPQTSPNQQFDSVVKTDDYLEVKLSGGETVKVPIVADFFCYFDAAITGEQKINPGETKTYTVHINGAESTIITTPMGWKATLGEPVNKEAVLTVIAPAAAATSRAIADNTRDISILALKGTFATLTKIQVNPIEVGGGAVTPPVPSGPVTELTVPLTASTTFTNIGKYSSTNKISSDVDCWFQRDVDTPVTTVSVDASIPAFKAVVVATKGAWNNSSFGFHSTETFEWKAKYKLTFQAQSNIAGSVGVGLRTGGDDRGFRMINSSGENWQRNVTTPVTTTSWEEISLIFDLGYASTAMTSTATTYNAGESETTEEDVKGINIYFYNNKENTTLYIKDIKLVKQ